jgi:hypothetical protein
LINRSPNTKIRFHPGKCAVNLTTGVESGMGSRLSQEKGIGVVDDDVSAINNPNSSPLMWM